MPKKNKYMGDKRGAKPFYPWNKWLAKTGKYVYIKQGRDFSCLPSTINVMIRNQCKNKGIREIHIHKYIWPDAIGWKFIIGPEPLKG